MMTQPHSRFGYLLAEDGFSVRDPSLGSDLGISVPEIILPEQYFEPIARRAAEMPEKRLLYAVLLDALLQLQQRGTPAAREAEQWICRTDEEWPFSFQNVCEALGLEPAPLARRLLAWCHGSVDLHLLGVPARQLRTSHARIRPLRVRRRASGRHRLARAGRWTRGEQRPGRVLTAGAASRPTG